MKNRTKKLQLNRETLRALDPKTLVGVHGAAACITGGENTSIPTGCLCGTVGCSEMCTASFNCTDGCTSTCTN